MDERIQRDQTLHLPQPKYPIVSSIKTDPIFQFSNPLFPRFVVLDPKRPPPTSPPINHSYPQPQNFQKKCPKTPIKPLSLILQPHKLQNSSPTGQCLSFRSTYASYLYRNRMNTSREFGQVGSQGILTKSILTEKQFQLSSIEWKYENNFQLSLLAEEQTSKLRIKNHLCEMADNTIKKVTEITFRDRKYIIEDVYAINLPVAQQVAAQEQARESKDGGSTHESDKNDKKVYIFKKIRKRKLVREANPDHSRNTKNITKNFCKAFIAFLKNERGSRFERRTIREAVRAYSSLLETRKYNNNLIKTIIANAKLRELFRYFLQNEAAQWINESRVTDKTFHQEAINVYLNLFAEISPLAQQPHAQQEQEEQEQDDQVEIEILDVKKEDSDSHSHSHSQSESHHDQQGEPLYSDEMDD